MNQIVIKSRLSYFVFVIVLVFLPRFGAAGIISIDSTVSSSIRDGSAVITFKLYNNGDETAHDVEIEADFEEKKTIVRQDRLPAGSCMTKRFEYRRGFECSQMVVPLIARYKDQNRYPFSAVSYATVSFASDSPRVFCKIEDVQMTQNGSLVLKMKSFDQKDHRIRLRIVAPQELTVRTPVKILSIPADTTIYESFEVQNFSALPPSIYTVLAVISEERPTGRYEHGYTGKVSIIHEKTVFDVLSYPFFAWGVAGLLLVYIGFQLYTLIHRKKVQ
ncbi:MAG: hypothetical protein R6U50_11700 [Desulfobacterales bacterium]